MAERDPYRYFRIEAADLVERLGQGALAIERGVSPVGGMAALLRYAHTLKGAARVVKQVAIAEHAHAIEDVLAPHRAGTGGVPPECAARLVSELDAIGSLLSALGAAPASGGSDGAPPVVAASGEPPRAPGASRPLEPARSAPGEVATVRAELGEVEAVVDGLGEALVDLESLEKPLAALDHGRQLAELLARQLSTPARAGHERSGLALERCQQVAEDLRHWLGRADGSLRCGLGRLRGQLEQTHACAEGLRLVPAGSVFTSLERAAYDAARQLDRQLSFVSSGADVKLDSHVLAMAQRALLHVVRNAVAHGLEPETERLAVGKPARGSIWLSVERRASDIVFCCRDDGAGADLERVRRLLEQAGEEGASLSDEQVLERLSRGGISTTPGVTRVSGRGVGLDVLREASEQLGGSIRLASTRGRGFSVELRAPMSVAALPCVAAEAGGRVLSVPLDRVVESVRFDAAQITRSGARESVCHQGRVLPFVPLARLLGGGGAASGAEAWTSLIVRGASGQVAVGVERLIGARTLVLRPLPEAARASPLVAGAALDALGNPELVLDGDALVRAVQRHAGAAPARSPARRPILVIDDSLTTRMLEQSILESAGYEVALASSGEEGLEKARRGDFALFLVDVEMPGMDGFAFVDRARNDPLLSRTPAVLVSSRSAPEDLERGKQVGARGYIVKGSFEQRELLGLIDRLVTS